MEPGKRGLDLTPPRRPETGPNERQTMTKNGERLAPLKGFEIHFAPGSLKLAPAELTR